QEQLANAARTQLAVSRAVLAQQLNSVSDSTATRDFDLARRAAARDGRLVLPGRPRVGFQPVISTLPEGTNMTATAVISADRRYVRVTAVPLFSVIGDVSTFNFSTGTTTDPNDPNANNNNAAN
ncbi:MAG: hypothetical protein KDA41_12055, partial [Planctomycetales bacterium]|nr:hypothetical protein [Planctomycetales bacterium]